MESIKAAALEIEQLETLSDIDDMLMEGVSPLDVANYVKFTLRRMEAHSLETVKEVLRVRKQGMDSAGIQPGPERLGRALAKVDKKVTSGEIARKMYDRLGLSPDPLIEVASLYLAVRDRIDRRIEAEDTENPDQSLYREFEEARRLLETMVSTMETMGIIGAAKSPETTPMDVMGIRRKNGEQIVRVLNDPKSRHRVIEVVNQITRVSLLAEHDGSTN